MNGTNGEVEAGKVNDMVACFFHSVVAEHVEQLLRTIVNFFQLSGGCC